MKTIWTSGVSQGAAKYVEHAPMAAVCCNACRACATTNALALASGAVVAATAAVVRLARRAVGPVAQG